MPCIYTGEYIKWSLYMTFTFSSFLLYFYQQKWVIFVIFKMPTLTYSSLNYWTFFCLFLILFSSIFLCGFLIISIESFFIHYSKSWKCRNFYGNFERLIENCQTDANEMIPTGTTEFPLFSTHIYRFQWRRIKRTRDALLPVNISFAYLTNETENFFRCDET